MHCFEDKEYQVDPQCNVKFDQQQIKLQSLMKPQVTKCSDTQVAHCTSKAPGVKAFKPPHNGRRQLQSDVKCDQLHALTCISYTKIFVEIILVSIAASPKPDT
nr:uncharacterized protein LOC113810774 [Penaeus vannamei]